MADAAALPSPCRGTCRLGADGLCDGCGRSIREISDWIELGSDGRRQVMDRLWTWTPRDPLPRA